MFSLLFVKLLPSLFLWEILITFATAQDQSNCNVQCPITNDEGEVHICAFTTRHVKTFESCCTKCKWFDFHNHPLGDSFTWNHQSRHYGEYNCINLSNNNVMERVLIIPYIMTENCSDCLSITACTAQTSHDLYLSGSLLFNEQILDGTSCDAYSGNMNFLDNVPELPYNVPINNGTNLSSIYIQCQLCGSQYMLTYHLPRSIASCHSLPQSTTTFSAISISPSQSSMFGYSSTVSHNDSAIPVTTTVMSTVLQTQTPNMSSSLPAKSIAPGEFNDKDENTGLIAGITSAVGIIVMIVLAIFGAIVWKKKRNLSKLCMQINLRFRQVCMDTDS